MSAWWLLLIPLALWVRAMYVECREWENTQVWLKRVAKEQGYPTADEMKVGPR